MIGMLFVLILIISVLLWLVWFQGKEYECIHRICEKQSRTIFELEEEIKRLNGET